MAGTSRPASAMPRTTPALTPAARARSPVARGSGCGQGVQDLLAGLGDAGVGQRFGARCQPVAGGAMPGATTRSAIAITSPVRTGCSRRPNRRTGAAPAASGACRSGRTAASACGPARCRRRGDPRRRRSPRGGSGNQHHVAGFRVQVGRDAVVEWAGERVRQQDRDASGREVATVVESRPPPQPPPARAGEGLDRCRLPPSARGEGVAS